MVSVQLVIKVWHHLFVIHMLHNNVLLEVYPERICSCIVEVKPKLSILWYICTSLTYCIWTHPRYNSSLSRIIQWMDGSWMDVGIVFFLCVSWHTGADPLDVCMRVTLGSCLVTAMSRRCLESELCSLTHSLQTLHHTFACHSHQPIHAEERKWPFPLGVSSLFI